MRGIPERWRYVFSCDNLMSFEHEKSLHPSRYRDLIMSLILHY